MSEKETIDVRDIRHWQGYETWFYRYVSSMMMMMTCLVLHYFDENVFDGKYIFVHGRNSKMLEEEEFFHENIR